MRHRRLMLGAVTVGALLAPSAVATADNPWEHQDIFGQGMEGPTVAEDGAAIRRTAKGLTAMVTMPTPEPGTYDYPTGPTASGEPGHPEAFSLWLFVFFNPNACATEDCGPADLVENPDVVAGAFNAGGHLASGPKLTISGRVNEQTAVFGGPNAESISEALAMGFDIDDAVVHVAIAPHGGLDPELMPGAIKTPVGNPSFWWMALYK